MEKCVFFPTFSIFHALGSILTTGGVLGSWTLVKLLSSPLEEGRTNIKGQMGLGPQPIHEKWWWRKVDPQQIGNQLVMVSVCLVNIDELHVFVISWKIHFLLGTLWLHVSITNAIGNSLCCYLPVPRVIESVESEVATPALSQHSSLRRFLNKAPDLVNGTNATCTKQAFSSFFGEHPRDHWGTIRTNGCTFGFFRPGSTMQTRSKHAHACRTISAPCCQLSNPSISTKPPIPTASSLETWWKRNNLAGMERDLPGMPTDQPFSHQPALCCSPTLLHVGNGRLSESRPRLKWRETSGSFLGLWNWPLPTVFLFLWTGLAGLAFLQEKKGVTRRIPFCSQRLFGRFFAHHRPTATPAEALPGNSPSCIVLV